MLAGSSSIVPPSPVRSNIDDDGDNDETSSANSSVNSGSNNSNNNGYNRNSVAYRASQGSMDRQPMAPRRSISPVQRRPPTEKKDTTLKSSNTYKNDTESTVDEDLEFLAQLYGGDQYGIEDQESNGGQEEDEFPDYLLSSRLSFNMMPPPPPLRHISEHEHSSPNQSSDINKHIYDRNRKPQRSALRKANNRNRHSIDNSEHKSKDFTRGIGRNHSADGTEDTRRGSGSLQAVRMRGSIYPVQHRRQSIGFKETVRVQEVTPTVELNDGNTRDLWLQADEAMEIKERRRSLLKRYREREARKKREAERRRRELEKKQQNQKVKNLLSPPNKNNKNSLNSFLSQTAVNKKQARWGGILKKPDLPLPGQDARRWDANDPSAGLSVPSRAGLYMGNATSSFLSTSSGGSSFSGHDSDSFRGLEKYIDRSGKHQKNMVWDAVFIEQDEQLQFGYYDDERIADLYRTVQNQHDGQQKAVGRARKDRKAANNYLMTPRTLKLLKKTINVNTDNISNLACCDLLQEDTSKDTVTSGNDDSLGNHGKTDANNDGIDAHGNKVDEINGKTQTAALKNRGEVKRHNKFLRRLSV